MTVMEQAILSRDEARSLTEEVRQDAERLWLKLVELYEGQAHVALGYSSWASYFETEFGGDGSRSYQLLQAGRVMKALEPTENFPLPKSDSVARQLAPLLERPQELRQVWEEVTSTDTAPTAAIVRDAVQQRVGPMSRKAEINAEAAKRRLYDALSSVTGYSAALAEFDVARLATATPDDLETWDRFAAEAIRSLRTLRQNIKEVS